MANKLKRKERDAGPGWPSGIGQVAEARTAVRFTSYTGTSLVSFVLAQAAIAIFYGILRWPVSLAVVLSLVVSIAPAYWLSKTFVWPREIADRRQEATRFVVVASGGAAVSLLVVSGSVAFASSLTNSQGHLALVAQTASIVSTVAIWIVRFFILDRFVFAPPDAAHPAALVGGHSHATRLTPSRPLPEEEPLP